MSAEAAAKPGGLCPLLLLKRDTSPDRGQRKPALRSANLQPCTTMACCACCAPRCMPRSHTPIHSTCSAAHSPTLHACCCCKLTCLAPRPQGVSACGPPWTPAPPRAQGPGRPPEQPSPAWPARRQRKRTNRGSAGGAKCFGKASGTSQRGSPYRVIVESPPLAPTPRADDRSTNILGCLNMPHCHHPNPRTKQHTPASEPLVHSCVSLHTTFPRPIANSHSPHSHPRPHHRPPSVQTSSLTTCLQVPLPHLYKHSA